MHAFMPALWPHRHRWNRSFMMTGEDDTFGTWKIRFDENPLIAWNPMASCFGKPCPFPLPAAKDFQGPSLQARRASVQQTERPAVAKERKPPNMKYHAHTVKSADLGRCVQQFYLASIQTLVKKSKILSKIRNPNSLYCIKNWDYFGPNPNLKIQKTPKSEIQNSESKTAPFRAAKWRTETKLIQNPKSKLQLWIWILCFGIWDWRFLYFCIEEFWLWGWPRNTYH